MTKEDILEYAARYVDADDISDFPEEKDIFCFLHRELPENKILKDEEGWQFGGYAVLDEYELDIEAKPVGKWIVVHYTSLASFPPRTGQLQLQPPHIALGQFQSPDRTMETRILRITGSEETPEEREPQEPKIMQFPGRKK